MEIFEFEFMQRAFVAGILLSVIISVVGVVVVLRRLSMIGDALSHTSLAGVAIGLLIGINPIVGAIVASLLAAFSIEAIRKRLPQYAELSVAIVMSAGIGIAGVASGFVSGTASFNSFLFGSIVAIDDFEFGLIIVSSVAIFAVFIMYYKELFSVAFDERSARLAGVKVALTNTVFIVLTAITVSLSARTVGALVVSSLMVIPVACSMQIARNYKQTVIFSAIFAVSFTILGLFISFYLGLKPGATIVLVSIVVLVFLLFSREYLRRRQGSAK